MKLFWEGITKNYYEALIRIIFSGIICLLMIILWIIFIHVVCVKKKITSNIEKKFCIGFFISIVVGFIGVWGTFVVNDVLVLMFGIILKKHCFYGMLSIFGAFCVHKSILYTFMIFRIKILFKETKYALNDKCMYIWLIFVVLFPLGLAFCIAYFSYIQCYLSDTYTTICIIAAVLDVSVSFALSYLFIKKLRQLIKDNTYNKSDKLLDIANRITLLTIIASFSSISTAIFILPFERYANTMASMDILINNICMFLTFTPLTASYHKLCCCCIYLHNTCFLWIHFIKQINYIIRY